MAMTSVQVAPAQEGMSRAPSGGGKPDSFGIKAAKLALECFKRDMGLRPITDNTPAIVPERDPGALMRPPYKAPKPGEVVVGYELFFPREIYGPFACGCSNLNHADAWTDCCCTHCGFMGILACLLAYAGVPTPCMAFALKKNQNMCQRPVYAKPGTPLETIVPAASYLYTDDDLEPLMAAAQRR